MTFNKRVKDHWWPERARTAFFSAFASLFAGPVTLLARLFLLLFSPPLFFASLLSSLFSCFPWSNYIGATDVRD